MQIQIYPTREHERLSDVASHDFLAVNNHFVEHDTTGSHTKASELSPGCWIVPSSVVGVAFWILVLWVLL